MKHHTIALTVTEYEPGDEREPIPAKLLYQGSFLHGGKTAPYAVAATDSAVLVRAEDHLFVLAFSAPVQALLGGIPVPHSVAPDPNDKYSTLGAMVHDGPMWQKILRKYGVTDEDIRIELGIRSRTWIGHEHIAKDLVKAACERAQALKAKRREVALADVRAGILEGMNKLEAKGLEELPEDAVLEAWVDAYIPLKGETIATMSTADLMALAAEIRAEFADAEDLFERDAKEERHG